MATFNLFPSNPPAYTASTDTGSTITSTEFLVTATCWATAIRWFRPNTTNTAARTAQIWRMTSATAGTPVGPQHTLPIPATEGTWGMLQLQTPIELTPGRYRIAVMHAEGRFQRADNYYAAGNPGATQYVNGPITRVAGSNTTTSRQAAWLTSATNVMPTTYSASGFFDDIVVSDTLPVAGPTIGGMQDYLNQTFSNGPSTSQYHLYAAGRPATGAKGIVVQLHGDGAGEFASPNSGVLAGYNAAALAHGMIMLAPKSPDGSGVRTWWENGASPLWLLDLLDFVRSKYAIDETKVWFAGFSGGAEVLTYWLMSDYSNRMGQGGSIMLGGGGASGLVFGRTPTAAFKANQRLHWAVGSLDTNDGEGFNAVAASLGGQNRYATEGFAYTTRELIPGEGHLESEDDGPRVLAQQLAKAFGSPTDPGTTPEPVDGLGGMQDYLNQTFTNGAKTSDFHLYAAGRPSSGKKGLVVQLHGDGAGEFDDPNGGTLAGYNTAAKDQGMILLAPRTPDRSGSWTWWENQSSPVWLLDLLDFIRTKYSIDETKIWFMGYSGGAEVQTYWLLSDYSHRLGSGGNIMLGGGGADGLVFSRQPTAAFKAAQRLHWAVGALDTDDGEGFNAVAASLGGYNRYRTEGFANTSRELIPGEGHLQSEDDGPRILTERLASAYGTPGGGPIVLPPDAGPDIDSDPWVSVTLVGGGTGSWSQVSGAPVTLAGTGNVRSFVAPASMATQALVFDFGGDRVTVNIARAKNGIVTSQGAVAPVKMRRI